MFKIKTLHVFIFPIVKYLQSMLYSIRYIVLRQTFNKFYLFKNPDILTLLRNKNNEKSVEKSSTYCIINRSTDITGGSIVSESRLEKWS